MVQLSILFLVHVCPALLPPTDPTTETTTFSAFPGIPQTKRFERPTRRNPCNYTLTKFNSGEEIKMKLVPSMNKYRKPTVEC